MARNQSAGIVWAQYLAARVGAAALSVPDVEDCLRAAKALGRGLYRIDHRHRQRARENVARSFPELSPSQIDRLTCNAFEHLVQLVVEICQAPRLIHIDSWTRRIRLGQGLGPGLGMLTSGKPVLMVTGHLGNWEILGYLLGVLGIRFEALARPIDNPLINQWLLGIRERRGVRVLTKWQATDRMLEVIRQGGALGFIADQNAGDKGLFVPFFGRLASTYKSIGLLALSHRVPIICGYAARLDRGYRYELGVEDIIHPEDWSGQEDPLYYVTARYMRAIETMIRARPDQYLWMHRRWKSRPRHERLGKPMPASLCRKLEQLPWMEQDLLNQLRTPNQPVAG